MDGGRFDVEFENEWFTSVAPGTNQFSTASFEDPKLAKILGRMDTIDTKISDAVTNLRKYIYAQC
jgi:hypothetical protein